MPCIVIPAQVEIQSLDFQALIRKGLLCDSLDSRLRGNDDTGRSYLNWLQNSHLLIHDK